MSSTNKKTQNTHKIFFEIALTQCQYTAIICALTQCQNEKRE